MGTSERTWSKLHAPCKLALKLCGPNLRTTTWTGVLLNWPGVNVFRVMERLHVFVWLTGTLATCPPSGHACANPCLLRLSWQSHMQPVQLNRFPSFADQVARPYTPASSAFRHASNRRHNIKMWVPPTKPDELIGPKSGPPQSSWDWRKLGKVTPAKDQGRCGSCYAFAAAGAIESKLLIQFNKTTKDYLVDLSEQQLVDCANAKAGRSLTGGCDGGNFNDVLWYSAR